MKTAVAVKNRQHTIALVNGNNKIPPPGAIIWATKLSDDMMSFSIVVIV